MGGQRILINGAALESIPVSDRGLHYGDGVFETLAVSAGEPLVLEEHLARLQRGLSALGLPDLDPQLIIDEIPKAVSEAPHSILKIIVTSGSGGRGYRRPTTASLTRILSGHDWPDDYNEAMYRDGIALTQCATRLSGNPRLAGIKHLNRLEQVMARSEWDDPGIMEGIMLDPDGHVIEGTMSNLFISRSGRLATPALDNCGIHGIMRRLVQSAAADCGIDCQVRQLVPEDLHEADEVFICNSVLGVCHVRQFQKTRYQQSNCTAAIREVLIKHAKILSP